MFIKGVINAIFIFILIKNLNFIVVNYDKRILVKTLFDECLICYEKKGILRSLYDYKSCCTVCNFEMCNSCYHMICKRNRNERTCPQCRTLLPVCIVATIRGSYIK